MFNLDKTMTLQLPKLMMELAFRQVSSTANHRGIRSTIFFDNGRDNLP
jgi:hypothetical protein